MKNRQTVPVFAQGHEQARILQIAMRAVVTVGTVSDPISFLSDTRRATYSLVP